MHAHMHAHATDFLGVAQWNSTFALFCKCDKGNEFPLTLMNICQGPKFVFFSYYVGENQPASFTAEDPLEE